ncbi:Adenine-specific DNA methylase [Fructobacillus cardui]|uniref:Dam family site-specific DNA-(adenine-N6)-methyltransferase n=1 Tax=Fructobacillus cardui TaxID=2893170 RepID=UPI002D95BC33|nr:Adenine-specific DNA methylase [Fructobacillus cardui]
MIKSFINYPGGKYKLLPQLKQYFPKEYVHFIDLFAGSAVVATNIPASSVSISAYDNNQYLIGLLQYVCDTDVEEILANTLKNIQHFNLTDTFNNGYMYYNVSSNEGLGSINKANYNLLRKTFNDQVNNGYVDYSLLYVLIIFGFNNQMRFNKEGNFNNPVGKRDFNRQMREKLFKFKNRINSLKITFVMSDFRDVSTLIPDTFFYVDPPYLSTTAVYNENGGWTVADEKDLLSYLDKIHQSGNKFALSNVLTSKGKSNNILRDWLLQNGDRYRVIHLNKSYANSNYQTSEKHGYSDEVLVINY